MNKLLTIVPVIVLLSACGTSDPYAKRAEVERERNMKSQERILDKTPKWFNEVPISSSAVYEVGFGSSFNMTNADAYAKNDAYGKLCMTAGGKTNQMTKTFSSEGENNTNTFNERAIKSFCPSIDLTGVEQKEIKRIVTPNGKFNTYVLIVLPTGDANILKKAKTAQAEREAALRRAPNAFKEMDNQ